MCRDPNAMIGVAFSEDTYPMRFSYTNWRGEWAIRYARPVRMFFGSTGYHADEQWLMEMVDLDKNETRVFAMRDMERISA